MTTHGALARRLGLGDAVVLGLGSMIGAGIFSVFAPAAAAAGTWLLVGLGVAAIVAFCNATSSAQLAAAYPSSGGTYLYGREQLGPWWGFAAGWSFVIGKTASCAAMALTFASYAAPPGWSNPFAIAAVLALAAVNYFGVTRTAQLARVIVVLVLAVLAVVVAAGASGFDPASFAGGTEGSVYGVLQSAGLLFFAFAGYARIATMGEEVRSPERTIPRAITISLTVVVVLYAVVGAVSLGALGPAALAGSSAPLRDVTAAAGWAWAVPIVQFGGALASLGALLALVAGVGRTALAMARERDLPRFLSAVHPRWSVPHRAEIALALVVVALVATVDVRSAIGFSSFGVLLYYFVANLAAVTQGAGRRRYPRAVQVLGMLGCAVLVVTLPPASVVVGVLVLAVGFGARGIRLLVDRARH
ncbi:APC family permease [Leifsonia sp. NPDC058248]|uniref:APC family permease n=1 Tax=Leifsonia sp. NPDC058248 TaxID=3346402 RepID=UPI0036DD3EC8